MNDGKGLANLSKTGKREREEPTIRSRRFVAVPIDLPVISIVSADLFQFEKVRVLTVRELEEEEGVLDSEG